MRESCCGERARGSRVFGTEATPVDPTRSATDLHSLICAFVAHSRSPLHHCHFSGHASSLLRTNRAEARCCASAAARTR